MCSFSADLIGLRLSGLPLRPDLSGVKVRWSRFPQPGETRDLRMIPGTEGHCRMDAMELTLSWNVNEVLFVL